MEGMLGDYANLWIIGQPIDINYNLKTIGVWQLDEAEEAAKYGCKPGQYKVLDLNGDGAINDADRVIDGKRTPSLTGGMTNNLVYKILTSLLVLLSDRCKVEKSVLGKLLLGEQ